MTHRTNVLKKYGLEDKSYSIKELSAITKVPYRILREVYNRGIGAYKTNPVSVRLKHSYVKNVDAPMRYKLSKERWGYARIYSFLDGNPKHDNDLRQNISTKYKMPFRIRKVPKKELYWVYDDKGKRYSKEGLTEEMAKKQLTALNLAYLRKEGRLPPRVEGSGAVLDIWEAIKGKIGSLSDKGLEKFARSSLGEKLGEALWSATKKVGKKLIGRGKEKKFLKEYSRAFPDDDVALENVARVVKGHTNDWIVESPTPIRDVPPNIEDSLSFAIPPETHRFRPLPPKAKKNVSFKGGFLGLPRTKEEAEAKIGALSKKALSGLVGATGLVGELFLKSLMNEAGKKKGGSIPPKSTLVEMAQASYKGDPDEVIEGYKLVKSTATLKFYKSLRGNTIVVAIRGTKPTDVDDITADALIPINLLETSKRYKKDEGDLKLFLSEYPPSSYEYYGVAHSLGGAILDAFLRNGYLRAGVSYNPAIQLKDLTNPKSRNYRIYSEGDPLYKLFGSKATPKPELRKGKPKSVFSFLISKIPKIGDALSSSYDYVKSHALDNFKGGVSIPKKEFVKEHKKLVKVLSTGSKKDRLKEAVDQLNELKRLRGGADEDPSKPPTRPPPPPRKKSDPKPPRPYPLDTEAEKRPPPPKKKKSGGAKMSRDQLGRYVIMEGDKQLGAYVKKEDALEHLNRLTKRAEMIRRMASRLTKEGDEGYSREVERTFKGRAKPKKDTPTSK